MNRPLILAMVLIILGGSIISGQDDSIPKITEGDSIYVSEAEADSIYDGYYLGQNYPNPF
jgi:hypothetical protein